MEIVLHATYQILVENHLLVHDPWPSGWWKNTIRGQNLTAAGFHFWSLVDSWTHQLRSYLCCRTSMSSDFFRKCEKKLDNKTWTAVLLQVASWSTTRAQMMACNLQVIQLPCTSLVFHPVPENDYSIMSAWLIQELSFMCPLNSFSEPVKARESLSGLWWTSPSNVETWHSTIWWMTFNIWYSLWFTVIKPAAANSLLRPACYTPTGRPLTAVKAPKIPSGGPESLEKSIRDEFVDQAEGFSFLIPLLAVGVTAEIELIIV